MTDRCFRTYGQPTIPSQADNEITKDFSARRFSALGRCDTLFARRHGGLGRPEVPTNEGSADAADER